MKKYLLFSLVLLLITFIALPVMAGNFPVTIVDDLGRELSLDKAPERIISLSPSNTEVLFFLGLGDKIIGVTTYANYPEEALNKEKIGTITEPNIEKIITMKPDLVIASGVNNLDLVERLIDLGINVAGFNPATVNDTLLTLKKIGKLTGSYDKAREIVTDMYIKMAALQELVDKHLKTHERPGVFYEIWSEPLITAGKGTFINDIINLAGGINIGAQARGFWPQYSVEKLVVENPDVYISSPHSAPHQVTEKRIENRERYQTINAIKNNRVHIVNQDIINRPSPRIIQGFEVFVKAIFPELSDEVEGLN